VRLYIPWAQANTGYPVGKIAEKAVWRSVFSTKWHCTLSAESTKTHSFRLFFCCKNTLRRTKAWNFSTKT